MFWFSPQAKHIGKKNLCVLAECFYQSIKNLGRMETSQKVFICKSYIICIPICHYLLWQDHNGHTARAWFILCNNIKSVVIIQFSLYHYCSLCYSPYIQPCKQVITLFPIVLQPLLIAFLHKIAINSAWSHIIYCVKVFCNSSEFSEVITSFTHHSQCELSQTHFILLKPLNMNLQMLKNHLEEVINWMNTRIRIKRHDFASSNL